MNIENIKQLMDNLDIASLLPDIMDIVNGIVFLAKIALYLPPLILLGLGLYYFLVSPREANYTAGYRCHWGMGSEEAWRYTQKLAGVLWTLAGLTMTVGVVLLGYRFAAMELADVLWKIILCLVFQALVVLVLRIVIHLAVIIRFDRKGKRRYTWVQLWRGY